MNSQGGGQSLSGCPESKIFISSWDLGDWEIMNDKESGKGPLYGKKIVLLAEYYASGGTRTYLKQLLDFYAKQHARVMLVGQDLKPDPKVRDWLAKFGFEYTSYWDIMEMNRFTQALPNPKVWSIRHMMQERRSFKRFLMMQGARGIVVSAGTPGRFAGAAGATRSGIYILHTYPHGRRQQLFGRYFMRKIFNGVQQLVAVSQFQREEMNRLWNLGNNVSPVIVIQNTAGPCLPDIAKVESSPIEVITASWLEPYKEPLQWLDVAKGVISEVGANKVRFRWFGEGSMLDQCRAVAQEVSNLQCIEFAGHIDDLSQRYSRADIYLQMSTTENMSLSLIDALRHGVPSVCSNVGGTSEVQVQGKTGLIVPPNAPSAAIDALVTLIGDSKLRKEMSTQSRIRYAEIFSDEVWTARMMRLHNKVYDTNGGAGESRTSELM